MLGFRGNTSWRDMSEYTVHFTKATGQVSAFDASLAILSSGSIAGVSRCGAARNIDDLSDSQSCACFSEVPLDMLQRLVDRRSSFGLAFRKEFLLAAGGGPVWYVAKDTPIQRAVQEKVRATMMGGIDREDPLWRITPFIDSPGEYNGSPYFFEWEREWRVPGGLRFSPGDVEFLFMPESLHEAASNYFATAARENLGPAYSVPLLDPSWPESRLGA